MRRALAGPGAVVKTVIVQNRPPHPCFCRIADQILPVTSLGEVLDRNHGSLASIPEVMARIAHKTRALLHPRPRNVVGPLV
jgi:hypothetical protein